MEFQIGDRVAWKSHGVTVRGIVERKLPERTRAAGSLVDEPQYLVRSLNRGGTAVHKASALKKLK